jgi:Peptidase inhibitor I9
MGEAWKENLGWVFGLPVICASVLFLLALPSAASAASPVGEPECMIEPWECDSEEAPESPCMIEPWECEPEEKPELCNREFGRYIVVFWDWAEDPETLAHEQVEKYGGKLGFVYKYALKGYSAEYPKNVIDSVSNEPSVHYVEVDGIVEALGASSEGQADSAGEDDCVIHFGPAEPEPADSGSATVSAATGQIDSGGAASASRSSATASGSAKRCAKGKVRKGRRCVRRRTLSRQACASRKSPRRCSHNARD